jgi:hypothetical protein
MRYAVHPGKWRRSGSPPVNLPEAMRRVYYPCHPTTTRLCFRCQPDGEMERSLRTSQLRTPDEPRPARWRRGRPGRKFTMAALTVAAGLLLALGLSTAPAGAAVASSTAKTAPAAAPVPDTLSSCLTGLNNSYEFYTWCKGTSPTSFRTIANCSDGEAVLGVEYADGSGSLSYADCKDTDNLNSTLLTGEGVGWGILMCSNVNGTGTFAGYTDRSGDISSILVAWGNGNIPNGGTTLCDYSIGQATAINPTTPPT